MSGRVGLRRHRPDVEGDDPLDGLVNLFDLGIVLAVAFLVAGLGLSTSRTASQATPSSRERTITTPRDARRAQGRGEAVGTVYRLPDGRLVLADPAGGPSAPAP
ncbi:Protein of unknown function DUF2149 [Patulibacter medicamentivorans]|uniref:DUF2149 domain-containing protein n=1 Tax=Patulibacter medicamentivorans TaxID=1097667 RepID=H0E6T6_9ACTN|nr:DUF2149 domain-containing protein [Patulibacter medicamentivorans]EHN10619.1 Protein of unknown function DUF2149 [Patulibacter medicamentivorans]